MLFDDNRIRLIALILSYVYSQKRIWRYCDDVYGAGFDYRGHCDVA